MRIPSFNQTTPLPRLFSGPDSLQKIGRELDRLDCRRAVVFCGKTLGRESAPLALVRSALGKRCSGVFSGVVAHSPLPSVEAGVSALQELNADAVVAVGGGSAVVTARAASILLAEGGDARSLSTSTNEQGEMRSPRLMAAKLPQFVVPTTPTTAVAKAGSAVHDPESGDRLALFDPKTRAHSIFVHPELVRSAPTSLVMSASLDTFCTVLEGLMSKAGNPFSDALLMHAVRLLARRLTNPSSFDEAAVRVELVLAAVMSGYGTDATGAGLATVLGHAIGSHYGMDNGHVKAVVMPYAVRFNAAEAATGLDKIANALGLHLTGNQAAATAVTEALAGIFVPLGIPQSLRDTPVPREALSEIARRAMDDWFLRRNPRPIRSVSELLELLQEAW